MSEPTLDHILSQRHEARREVVNVDEPMVKLVIFALGDAWFAFHGSGIREILAEAVVHFVPGCPPSLEGVINVRGDIATVIRLHDVLQLPAPATGQDSAIMLGSGAGIDSGLRVDRIIDVVDVAHSSIQPPPATLGEPLRTLVLGVAHFQDRPVTVLDLDRLFADYASGLG
mgnify:CR=1 FL=1